MYTSLSFTRKYVWINERSRKNPEIFCQMIPAVVDCPMENVVESNLFSK